MAEYIDRIKLMDDLSPIVYENGMIVSNLASDIVYQIHDRNPADVVEREKIDKSIEEIKGQLFVLLKGETHIEEYWWNKALEKTLEILKRNIGESK